MKTLNKGILIFFCFVNFYYNSFCQNPLVKQWDYRFGGTSVDDLYSLEQTSDGGFILGGLSASDSSGDKTQASRGLVDFWIVKTDGLGNKEWDKRFGGTNNDFIYSMQQTSDGGYILGGSSASGISGDKTQATQGNIDYWIVKTDSLANKKWDKRFGGTSIDVLYSIQQTTDGGFILGGESTSGIGGDKTQASQGGDDYWIVKTDAFGNKEWDKRFGGTSKEALRSVQQTPDGGFILGGGSASGISGDNTQGSYGVDDYWLVKTDSLGNKEWDKSFGGTKNDYLYSLQQTSDGGFILGGLSYSGISGNKTQPNWDITLNTSDYWLVKTDSLGNKEWDKRFGGSIGEDEFGNVFITADKGFLLAGTSYSDLSGDKTENNLGVEQTWIVKIDSLGNKQWDKTIFTIGSYHDEQGLAIQAKDDCYVFANFTYAGIGGYKTQPHWTGTNLPYDYWFIKFCDTTLTTLITQLPNTQLPFSISPNPTTGTIQLTFNTKHNGAVQCEIRNVMGERVFTSPLAPLQRRGEASAQLDVSFLAKGIYFVKVIADGNPMVQKVVKM